MDGLLFVLLVVVGLVVVLDKGRHIWLRYLWFVILGFFLGWVGATLYIMFVVL
jgi:hypothetical protein